MKSEVLKRFLGVLIPILIILLVIFLFFSYQLNRYSSITDNRKDRTTDSSLSTTNKEEGESKSFFGDLFKSNKLCDYNEGENCQDNPSRCICKNNQICSPDRANSDNLGCYTVVCGDGYTDGGENSENCCLDAGCSNGLVCDANLNKCVKPQCPFDCCMGDVSYQDKSCPEYYLCINQKHSCEPIDSDNDGLPDYMEIQIGTDRFNPDTDGDTVLDGYDNNPLHESFKKPYIYQWFYGKEFLFLKKEFMFQIEISDDVFASYDRMPINTVSDLIKEDVHVKEVAQILNQLADAESFDDADRLMMTIAFSRSFNYDYTKANNEKPLAGFENFPMETILTKRGLCKNSAVMLVSLLREMEYDVKFLGGPCHEVGGIGHAIVGVPLVEGIELDGDERYVDYNGKRYYYVDGTSRDYSGNIFFSSTSKDDFGKTHCSLNLFEVDDRF